jgi:hypothetical protein
MVCYDDDRLSGVPAPLNVRDRLANLAETLVAVLGVPAK